MRQLRLSQNGLRRFCWSLLVLPVLLALTGTALLYSSAHGSWQPWAQLHLGKFVLSAVVMVAISFVPPRWWQRGAYVFYALALLLLLGTLLWGPVRMHSQRWIDLGFFTIQPSEIMKLAVILALAQYYHCLPREKVSRFAAVFPPLFIIGLPAVLVFYQPDLGTALLLVASGLILVFLSGISYMVVGLGVAGALGVFALAVHFDLLHDYQLARIRVFLDPEMDPLGRGYNISQSLITLGSGGLKGKGFMQGTQTQLGFLPERHTDFILPTLGEEFGFTGVAAILGVCALLCASCLRVAFSAKTQYGRLTAFGVASMYAFYVLINAAMVEGAIPVVGVPMPFLSYGGTVMMILMVGFGMVNAIAIYEDDERFADFSGHITSSLRK